MNAPARTRRWSARNVTAVLGPTNTGKTHLAIERMLGHESGVIGLPLRLLAREVYARVAQRAGADQVALVTGEEKIVPARPRYWVSTVEAMPRETDAAFVAIDEVQIAADLERGHVFTDRILNLRGSQETLLLGAATMRGIIEQLLPGVHVVTRPRMSVLAYSGQKKLTRLPERSAIVAFSADEVYAVAELIRRQRGGAAVVLGALSPRTRNKQVELYQSGDVDFLVATDAIGMGLNLDLDHVAFASNRKYDGFQFRELSAGELGQIAGRAGRHMHDGTFGVTGRVDPFPDPLVEALETHRFEPVRTVQWRNDELDFSSVAALKASLDEVPQVQGLTRAQPADDQIALEALTRDEEIAHMVQGPDQVRRLWDVTRLPDYRKISPMQHAELVGQIFRFIGDGGFVSDDWIAEHIRQANRADGDIDTLSQRIAHIRTWAFVANQADWLAEPATWREEAKAVEDKLSDALHERLTKRFVDRRTSVLMRRLRENTILDAEITPDGSVMVEGHQVGMLQGFRFTPDLQAGGAEAQTLRGAAQKALAVAMTDRADRLARAGDGEIVLSLDGHLRWQGEPVGRLIAGDDVLKPRIVLLADEQLAGASRDAVEARLNAWLTNQIAMLLKPLVDLSSDQALSGMARGIAFQLVESLGVLERRAVLNEVRGLDQEARAGLRRHGVRFGAYHIYIPVLLKPGPATLVAQLWALKHKSLDMPGLAELPAVSGSGRTSAAVEPEFDVDLYRRFGFRIYGSRAVRIDILERLADLIRPALSWTPTSSGERPAGAFGEGRAFTVTPAMTSLLGASGEDLAVILKGLGYRMERREPPVEAVSLEAAANEPAAAETAAAETAEPAAAAEPGAEAEAPTAEAAPAPTAEEPATEPAPSEATAAEPVSEAPVVEAPAEAPVEAAPELSGLELSAPVLSGPGAPVAEPAPEAEQPDTEQAVGAAEPAPLPEAQPEATAAPAPDATESAPEEAAATAQATSEAEAEAEAAAPDASASETPTPEESGPETAEPAEPVLVEVWRVAPARQDRGPRRPRAEGAPRHAKRRQDGEERRPEGEGREARPGDRQRPAGGGKRRPQRDDARREGGKRDGSKYGSGKREGGKPAQWQQRPKRERPVDPDSPFAKLEALKKELEKSGRE